MALGKGLEALISETKREGGASGNGARALMCIDPKKASPASIIKPTEQKGHVKQLHLGLLGSDCLVSGIGFWLGALCPIAGQPMSLILGSLLVATGAFIGICALGEVKASERINRSPLN